LKDIGRVFYLLHNHTGAVQYFDRTLSIDPNDLYALDGIGLALYRLHNYSQADYNKGLGLDPNFTGMLDNKALALAKLGNSLF
jgi:tetratricopeptide (TPR) repeat protein